MFILERLLSNLSIKQPHLALWALWKWNPSWLLRGPRDRFHMAKQHGRARLRPTSGTAWLELLIYPRTLVALHHNIWIIACHVPGKYPLSIKAFIYLSWTLNILVFNAVMFDVTDLLFVNQVFFSPLTKGRVGKEKYLLQSSQTEKNTRPLFYLLHPKYFLQNPL